MKQTFTITALLIMLSCSSSNNHVSPSIPATLKPGYLTFYGNNHDTIFIDTNIKKHDDVVLLWRNLTCQFHANPNSSYPLQADIQDSSLPYYFYVVGNFNLINSIDDSCTLNLFSPITPFLSTTYNTWR